MFKNRGYDIEHVVGYDTAIHNDVAEKGWGPWARGPKYKVRKGHRGKCSTGLVNIPTEDQQAVHQNLGGGIMGSRPFLFCLSSQFPIIQMGSFGNLMF